MKKLLYLNILSSLVLAAPVRDHGGRDPDRNSTPVFSYSIPNMTISSPLGITSGVAISKEIETISKQNIKKLEFDPVLRLEGNNGGFSTSFNYPLPPSKLSLNSLEFSYYTSHRENGFLGHGWRWNLPRITQKFSSVKYPYSTDGLLGNGSLMESSYDKKLILDELQSVIQKNTALDRVDDYTLYQLDYDDTHNLFVQVDRGDIGWIVFKLNGERWIFDKSGNPLKVVDLNGNYISLKWNSDKLHEITYPYGVSIKFSYDDGYKLSKIISTSSDDSSVFDIKYSNNQLIYAGYKDGVIPVFQGKYNNFIEKIKATTEVFDIEADQKEARNEDVEITLNSSDITKKITINYKDYIDEINRIIETQRWYEKGHERFVEDSHRGAPIKKMFDAVKFSIELRGKKLELPKVFHPFEMSVKVHDGYEHVPATCGNSKCSVRLHIIKNIFDQIEKKNLLLLDMDNDGHKDIVSCPIDGEMNQFPRYVLNSINPEKFPSVNIGNAGHANVGYMDWGDFKTPYKIKRTDLESFKCNQNSLFIDWNKDGRVDILNGHEITLNLKDEYKRVLLSNEDLRAKFSTDLKIIGNDSKLIIRDLNIDSTFEIYDFNLIKDKEIELSQNTGILSEIISPFDGKVQIDYRIYKNKYLLVNYFKYVGDDKTEEEKLYYKGASFNKDEFLGFSEILKVRDGVNQNIRLENYCNVSSSQNLGSDKRKIRSELCQESHFQSVEELLHYVNDSYKDSYDRYLSYYMNESAVNINSNQSIKAITYEPSSYLLKWEEIIDPYTDLFQEFSYFVNPLVVKNKVEYILGNNNFILGKTSNTKEYLKRDGKIFDSKSTETIYKYIDGIPKEITKKSDTIEKIAYEINNSKYVAMESVKDISVKSNLLSRAINHYDIERNLLVKSERFSGDDLASAFNEDNYSYDRRGRLKSSSNFDVETESYLYEGHFPLPTTRLTPSGRESFSHNLLNGQKNEFLDVNQNKTTKSFSVDGFVLNVSYNDNQVYSFAPPFLISNSYPQLFGKKISEIKKDTNFTSRVNSMGRVVEYENDYNEARQEYNYSLMGRLINSKNNFTRVDYVNLLNCNLEKTFSKVEQNRELSRSRVCSTADSTIKYFNDSIDIKKNEQGLLKYSQNGRSFVYPSYDLRNQTIKSFDFLPYEWRSNVKSTLLTKSFRLRRGAPLQIRLFDNKLKKVTDEYGQIARIHENGQLAEFLSKSDFVFSLQNEFDGADIISSSVGEFKFNYNYEKGLLKEGKFLNEKFQYSYDQFDRLVSFAWADFAYSLEYINSHVASIRPFISEIKRDSRDLVSSIDFGNNITMEFERDELGKVIKQAMSNKNKVIYSSSVSYLDENLNKDKVSRFEQSFFNKEIVSDYRYSNISMNPQDLLQALVESTLTSTFSTIRKLNDFNKFPSPRDLIRDFMRSIKIEENTKEAVPNIGPLTPLSRNNLLQVDRVRDLSISYVNDNPVSIKNGDDEIFQFFLPTGEMIGSCLGLNKLDIYSKNCWFKISDDNFIIKGRRVSILRVDSLPTILVVDDKSYPIVTDFRGSVASVIDPTSGSLLFTRDYNVNGLKKVYFNESDLAHAKEIENLTIWSFAHLFENPFLSNEDLYFSKSRILSARNGEWLTFDPMIKWNVEQLLNSPVDYNGIKYVNGDPVNFVDPSGYSVQMMTMGEGAGGVTAEDARKFNIEHGTHEAMDGGDFIKVIGSDCVAPIAEFTPVNNIVRSVTGTDPLNYFEPISPQERGSALIQEMTLGALGAVGKVGTKAFHIFKQSVDLFDAGMDGYDVYKSKKDTRY